MWGRLSRASAPPWSALPGLLLALVSCSPERFAGDEVGVFARDGIELGSISFDQGVSAVVFERGHPVAPGARDVQLISDRVAFVRATWQVPESWTPREIVAHLTVTDVDGDAVSALSTRFIEGPADLRYPDGAFDWIVPAERMRPASTWSVRLYEAGGARLDALAPPAFHLPKAAGTVGVLHGKHEIDVLVVPIDHQFDGPMECEGPPLLDDARLDDMRDYLGRINPVSRVNLQVRSEPMPWTESAGNLNKILDALSELREQDGAPPHLYYFGAIDPCDWGSTAGFAGLARVPDETTRAFAWKRVAVGDQRIIGHSSLETFVHEVGHTQERRHVTCKGNEGNPVDDYPNSMGDIETYGFDHVRWAIHTPTDADYMSYCDPTWVGPYGWNQVRPVVAKLTSWKYTDEAAIPGFPGSQTLMVGVYPDGTSRWWLRRGELSMPPVMRARTGPHEAPLNVAVHDGMRGGLNLEIAWTPGRPLPASLTLELDDDAGDARSASTSARRLHGRRLQVPEVIEEAQAPRSRRP